ncbi:MAG: YfhO family protein [Myxococcales bacterium]|jgi:hypothetical protein
MSSAAAQRTPLSRRIARRALGALAVLGAAAWVYRPVLSGEALAGRDIFRLFIPDAAFLAECLRNGELPLWNPYLWLGHPFAATVQAQAFYPPRVLAVLLFGPVWAITFEHLLHVALAVAGTAAVGRRLGGSRPGSWLAGSAFGLSVMYAYLGNEQNMANALAWTGPLLAAALDLRRGPRKPALLWLAASAGASALCGSPEILLAQGIAALIVSAWGRKPRPRPAARTTAGLAWGAALAAIALVPAAELAQQVEQTSAEAALAWSASLPDLATLVSGANPAPPDGQTQRLVITLHLGGVYCALTALAFAGRARRRRALPFAVAGLLLALLSLGANFAPASVVLGLFPFRLFRFPVKYLVAAVAVMAPLAALGFDQIVACARRRPRGLRPAGAGLFAVSLLAAARFASAGGQAGLGALLAALLVGLAGLLLGFLPGRPRARASAARAVLVGLTALELVLAHNLFGRPLYADDEALSAPARLAELMRAEPWTRFSRGSKHRNEAEALTESASQREQLERYVRLSREAFVGNRHVEERLSSIEGEGPRAPRRLASVLAEDERALFDFAAVTWYVRRGEAPFSDLERAAGGDDGADEALFQVPNLYRSRTAFPRAFVVHRAVAASEAEARAALLDPSRPLRERAFLELGPGESLPSLADCAGSTASIEEITANRVAVAVEACGDGVLVVSDSWFPGWQALVDGRRAPLYRANFLARAVPVSAGRHRVELFYRPVSFLAGAAVSSMALFAMGSLAFAGQRRSRSRS